MNGFLHYLLSLLSLMFQVVIGEITRRLFVRTFLRSNSKYNYLKLMERLKKGIYDLKVAILIMTHYLLAKYGYIKPIPKDQQNKLDIMVIITLVLIAVIYASKRQGNTRSISIFEDARPRRRSVHLNGEKND